MTDDQKPQQESAHQETHSEELDAEAMKPLQEWLRYQGFDLAWSSEATNASEAGISEHFRFERVPFELQEFGTVLIPDPRILEQGPLEVAIFVFEPQHDPMARGRPQASALYSEIKDAAAIYTHYLNCALQLKQRVAVHNQGMTKKEADRIYSFDTVTKPIQFGGVLKELLRIGSSLEKDRDQKRTEIGRSKALNNAVLAEQKDRGPGAASLAETSIKLSTTIIALIEKARYAVSTIESRRRAAMAADRKSGSTTPAELQARLFGGIDHDKIRTDFVGKTIFSFYTGINASRVWVDTCLPEWQKFFELVVFVGQLYDGRPAILTDQIYGTYIAIDRALSNGNVRGEAEAQAYAFVIDQLGRLIDKSALQMKGEQLAEDVDGEVIVADFSGFVGD